jgi:prevent-host-death family protein
MEVLSATDAKREFGEVLLKAQKEPIAINRNGKPVAVMISIDEYEAMTAFSEELLSIELKKGLKDVEFGRVNDGSNVIERLRKRVNDAKV